MIKHLPLTAMEKILKKAGAKRVSESAKVELDQLLKTKTEEISKHATNFSKHAGRKTLKKEDIQISIGN